MLVLFYKFKLIKKNFYSIFFISNKIYQQYLVLNSAVIEYKRCTIN